MDIRTKFKETLLSCVYDFDEIMYWFLFNWNTSTVVNYAEQFLVELQILPDC